MGHNDLSHVMSSREVVIALSHVTVFPRQHDAKTKKVVYWKLTTNRGSIPSIVITIRCKDIFDSAHKVCQVNLSNVKIAEIVANEDVTKTCL